MSKSDSSDYGARRFCLLRDNIDLVVHVIPDFPSAREHFLTPFCIGGGDCGTDMGWNGGSFGLKMFGYTVEFGFSSHGERKTDCVALRGINEFNKIRVNSNCQSYTVHCS